MSSIYLCTTTIDHVRKKTMLQLITGTNCTASRGYTMPPYTRILSIGYGGLVLFIIDKGYTTLSGGPCGYLSQLTAYLTHGGFSVRRTTRSEPSRVSRSGCMLSCPVLSCFVLFCHFYFFPLFYLVSFFLFGGCGCGWNLSWLLAFFFFFFCWFYIPVI